MELQLLEQELSVIHYKPEESIPEWALRANFFSITKTDDELSIFCDSEIVPSDVISSGGWRAFRIVGQIDLELAGMISSLALPLASKQISIFSISTHDTDYMVVRKESLGDAKLVLEGAGHRFV